MTRPQIRKMEKRGRKYKKRENFLVVSEEKKEEEKLGSRIRQRLSAN